MASPEEGSTAYIDAWMVSHTLRENPTLKRLAEAWIDYTISPDFQVEQVVRTLNNFPVNTTIVDRLTPEEIAAFHLNEPEYFQEYFIPWEVLDKKNSKGFELLWKKAAQ
jgi:spermidine/putrescine transport system substrate-binding protein